MGVGCGSLAGRQDIDVAAEWQRNSGDGRHTLTKGQSQNTQLETPDSRRQQSKRTKERAEAGAGGQRFPTKSGSRRKPAGGRLTSQGESEWTLSHGK